MENENLLPLHNLLVPPLKRLLQNLPFARPQPSDAPVNKAPRARSAHYHASFASISAASPGLQKPAFSLSQRTKNSKEGGKRATEDAGERILISEVEISGVEGELKNIVQAALTAKPNFAYTVGEIRSDLQRVFSTGYFSRVEPETEDTRDGVKLCIKVLPNPEMRGVVARGADALPTRVVEEAFRGLCGRTLNYNTFMKAVERLDLWYQDHGVVGQVTDFQEQGGVVELVVGEAQVGEVSLVFSDAKGNPVTGRTKQEAIMRHFTTRRGGVYNMKAAKLDLDSLYATGLFEDININAKESEASTELQPQVDLSVNLVERKSGGLGAGTGISAQSHGEGALPGFVGSFSYSQRNLFGVGQRLAANVELGQENSLFKVQHTDPWIQGDPTRTSRTIQLMNTRTSGAAIHGQVEGEPGEEDHPNSNIILGRVISGTEYRRPLTTTCSGALGLNWQQTRCMDEHSRSITADCYGSPLTFSGGPSDTMLLALCSAQYSGKDGGRAVASVEQALPLLPEWLNFSRLTLQVDRPVPLGPLTLNLMGRGGYIHGDLPPYEAFPIGGTNSVRGYSEGGVGSGRASMVGTAEVLVPLMKPLQGTLFMDMGSDLDTGSSVIGDPAGARGKPGSGYGYGAGVRVDSPLGPLRLEYAWNDKGQRRFHVGLGSHG